MPLTSSPPATHRSRALARRWAGPCALAAALLAPGALQAQAQTPATAATAAMPAPAAPAPKVPVYAPDPALLQAFGGVPGITRLTARFADRMRSDARIGHYFEKTKMPELKQQLADHFCQLLAGPCVYEGDTMRASHADLKIDRADSLAQVEILQDTMDELGLPFRVQNQLLARLAPMYREVITR